MLYGGWWWLDGGGMDGLQIFDDINLHSRKSLEAKLNFQSVPASAAQAAAAAEEANSKHHDTDSGKEDEAWICWW